MSKLNGTVVFKVYGFLKMYPIIWEKVSISCQCITGVCFALMNKYRKGDKKEIRNKISVRKFFLNEKFLRKKIEIRIMNTVTPEFVKCNTGRKPER